MSHTLLVPFSNGFLSVWLSCSQTVRKLNRSSCKHCLVMCPLCKLTPRSLKVHKCHSMTNDSQIQEAADMNMFTPDELAYCWHLAYYLSLLKVCSSFLNHFDIYSFLKGLFCIFEVGLYEVLIRSQSITFCRWRSAVPLLEEGRRNCCNWSQHCTVAEGVSRKMFFSNVYKCLPEESISVMLYAKCRIFFSTSVCHQTVISSGYSLATVRDRQLIYEDTIV